MRKQTLILGASSGIGYATALHLAHQNHDILGVARREKELLKGDPIRSNEGMVYGRMYREWKEERIKQSLNE